MASISASVYVRLPGVRIGEFEPPELPFDLPLDRREGINMGFVVDEVFVSVTSFSSLFSSSPPSSCSSINCRTQGWSGTSLSDIRSAGFLTSNRRMRSRAPSDTKGGNCRSTLEIRLYVAVLPSASKGGYPTRNSKRRTPSDQMSTCWSCSRPSIISGGR